MKQPINIQTRIELLNELSEVYKTKNTTKTFTLRTLTFAMDIMFKAGKTQGFIYGLATASTALILMKYFNYI